VSYQQRKRATATNIGVLAARSAFSACSVDRNDLECRSFRGATSMSIVLGTLIEKDDLSLEAFHWLDLLVSSSTAKWFKIKTKRAFSPSLSSRDDHDAPIFQTHLQQIDCTWCNGKEGQTFISTTYFTQSTAISVYHYCENRAISPFLHHPEGQTSRRSAFSE